MLYKGVKTGRDSEHNMEIRNRKQLGIPVENPLSPGKTHTFRTMPVPAGIV
jgi:hypothetical protein